jgi:hypothetical protein
MLRSATKGDLPAMPVASASRRVFISYRRQESSGLAGRLYDRLASHLGDDQVFMDVDTIALGIDFAEVITEAVSACEVLVAVIGQPGSAPPIRTADGAWTTPTTSSAWRSQPPWSVTSA